MYKINNNDFKILDKLKRFSNSLDKAVENIPNKDIIYKDKVKELALDLMGEIVFCSYVDKDKINEHYSLFKTKISLIDFLIDRFVSKGYIKEECSNKLLNLLVEINKMGNSYIKGLLENES